MILTKEIIEQGKSSNNGWNRRQLAIFGEEKQDKGWLKRLNGKEVTEHQVKQFLELKDYHLKNFLEKKKLTDRRFVKLRKPTFEPCNKVIEYKNQYLHPNWQKMRLFILDRDKFCCQECGAKDDTLHVHHLKYGKSYIWLVPTWYLVTLCDGCHSTEHGRDLTIKK